MENTKCNPVQNEANNYHGNTQDKGHADGWDFGNVVHWIVVGDVATVIVDVDIAVDERFKILIVVEMLYAIAIDIVVGQIVGNFVTPLLFGSWVVG